MNKPVYITQLSENESLSLLETSFSGTKIEAVADFYRYVMITHATGLNLPYHKPPKIDVKSTNYRDLHGGCWTLVESSSSEETKLTIYWFTLLDEGTSRPNGDISIERIAFIASSMDKQNLMRDGRKLLLSAQQIRQLDSICTQTVKDKNDAYIMGMQIIEEKL